MKNLFFLEDIIDSPCKLMSKDGQGLCLAMLPLQFCPVFYGLRVSPEEKHSSLGEGPFQMGIAYLLAG